MKETTGKTPYFRPVSPGFSPGQMINKKPCSFEQGSILNFKYP